MDKFKEKVCSFASTIVSSIPIKERDEKIIFKKDDMISKISGTYMRNQIDKFLDLFDIHYVIFGDSGEVGVIVFLNHWLDTVVKLYYEDLDENKSRTFFPMEK